MNGMVPGVKYFYRVGDLTAGKMSPVGLPHASVTLESLAGCLRSSRLNQKNASANQTVM